MHDETQPQLEEFEVGMVLYFKHREDPISAMLRVHGALPVEDPEIRKIMLMELAENHLWEYRNDRTRYWTTIENKNGDRLLAFNDELDAIQLLAPDMEEAE